MQSASESLKILPVLVCRKRQVKENFMEKKIKQLRKNLKLDVQILTGVVINKEEMFRSYKHVTKVDVIPLLSLT